MRPIRQREIVIKLFKEDMIQADISRRLKIPTSTVSYWLKGVRRRIDWPPLNRPLKWEIVDRKR